MKKLVLSFGLMISCYISIGQVPTPGSYVTNNNVDQLVGTWEWVSGQDIVEIRLQKIRTTLVDYDEDVLLGTHTYTKNAVVKESSMAEFDNVPLDHNKATLFIWNVVGTTTTFKGFFRDLTKSKRNSLELVYSAGSPPTLVWNLKLEETISPDANFQYGLTLPAQIVLVKQ